MRRSIRRKPVLIALSTLALAAAAWGARGTLPDAAQGVARLGWASADGALTVKRTFKHAGHVSAIAFSADGRYLAAGGRLERSVSVWDTTTGALTTRLVPDVGGVTALAWSRDGRRLAVGRSFVRHNPGRTPVGIWDTRTGHVVHDLREPVPPMQGGGDVWGVAFSPDGTQLAVCSTALSIYDALTGQVIRSMTGHASLGRAFGYLSDGRLLAMSGDPQRSPIQLYDVRTGGLVRDFPAKLGTQLVLAVSPDDRLVVSAAYDAPAIQRWDVRSGKLAGAPLRGHRAQIRALTFSPDGKWLGSVSRADSVKLWAVASGDLVESIAVSRDSGETLLFSPDGAGLAFSDGDVVKLWDFRAAPARLQKTLESKGR